ncbi:uncharacterized protein LOC119546523 [Drosophila subpulchrella]|uniref:uncharacterized protein LOC119546523 n=1 Tax=Drosophila subpulchrella TaxID=1486046 RepID=UPI0018A1AAE9|nr:uncharacterized protein LOC119546523 [Drosophila subpulchrella]
MTRQELLDEEFESLRRIALAICQNLGRPKDREICRSTLEELARLHHAPSIRIKENVHKFMMFYLKVLRWTQKNQPVDLYRQWYGENFGNDSKFASSAAPSMDEMRIWLEEGRSFYAMKTFEDGSTTVFTAVAKDPKAGWSENGLKTLMETQIGCALNQDDK